MANAAESNARGTVPNSSNAPTDGKDESATLSKPLYHRMLDNYLPSSQNMDKPSETPVENETTAPSTTKPAEATVPLTPQEIAKMQRDRLDTSYYAEIEAQAERAIKNPNRKLKWRPNIGPQDREWVEQRNKFRALLAANSVSDVLESEFEDAQKPLLIPPPENGELLQVQLENAKEYKAFFKPGAKFHGVADNLATKLTMLKFGFPIETATLGNIERCDNSLDEDDPPDGPEAAPAIERIIHDEMPLEFLDLYGERSFGYPMLRRPNRDHQQQPIIIPRNFAREGNKSNSTVPTENNPSVPNRHLNINHRNHALQGKPTSSKPRMRGGAGSSEELFLDIPRYIYGNDDDMSLVNYDKCSSFVDALFTLFSTEAYVNDSRTAWFFHIDVYQNHDKSTTKKKFHRTVDIDQENIEEKWSGTIRHLLFNNAHDWILRVQIARPLDKLDAPLKFIIPTPGTKLGSKPYVHWEEVKRKNTPNKDTPKQNIPCSYGPAGSKISESDTTKPNKTEVCKVSMKSAIARPKLFNVFKSQQVDAQYRQLTKPATAKNEAKNVIYGYCGKLEFEKTEDSFLRVALLLTDQNPADITKRSWEFSMDISSNDPDKKLSVPVTPENSQHVFLSKVLPNSKAGQPSNIFVQRRKGRVPTELEPPKTDRTIVRITLLGRGTAYWKVPSDLKTLESCGINQIQPGFAKAMHLLCHDEPRRKDKLQIDSLPLGSDNLECVDIKFWELIKHDLSRQAAPPEYGIIFNPMGYSLNDSPRSNIRMVGNDVVSAVSNGDHEALAKEIHKMLEDRLCDTKNLPAFRIWEDSQARVMKGHSAVIKRGTLEERCEELKMHFARWPQSHTLWFRSEWETFYLQDTDASKNTVEWDSRTDQSLHGFRKTLGKLWDDPRSYDSFCITEVPLINGRDFRFIVNKDTTEDDWRLYVFDWLHSPRLAVKRNTKVDYVLDTASQWGFPSPMPQPKPIQSEAAPKPRPWIEEITPVKPKTTPAQPKTMPTKPAAPNLVGNKTNQYEGSGFANTSPINHATTPKHPQFNQARIVKHKAAKTKPPKYATWLANENYQDSLQQQSYIQDQKAVIPGKLPAAPVYGPSRELQIKVSPNFPTVYAQRITPSDIDELLDENQVLRNKVLERMWACPTCNVSFKNYNNVDIREHMQEHIKQVQEAAECPMCGTANWAFMSMDQKRNHFEWHMGKENATYVQEQWREIQCPACDKSLSSMKPEAIIDHCLKHPPNIVQYCDKCGLHEAVCTKEELAHHQHVCRQAPERKEGDTRPAFCGSCGKDKSNQTEVQNALHRRDCQNKLTFSSRTFCTKCGLDITTFNNLQLAGHTSRCTVPRGTRRKFCEICATNLSVLDATDIYRHRHQCRINNLITPPSSVGQSTVFKNAKITSLAHDSYLTTPHKFVRQGREYQAELMDLDVKRLGKCPINNCHRIIGTMTREAMFNHFQSHSNIGAQSVRRTQATFKCPVIDHEGETCNQILCLESNDLRCHYTHRGTINEQAEVKAIGKDKCTFDSALKPLTENDKALRKIPKEQYEILMPEKMPIWSFKALAPKPSTVEDHVSGESELALEQPAKPAPKKRKQSEVEEDVGETQTGKKPAEMPAKKQKVQIQNGPRLTKRRVTRSTFGTPATQQ